MQSHAHTHTYIYSSCFQSNRRMNINWAKIPDRCHRMTTNKHFKESGIQSNIPKSFLALVSVEQKQTMAVCFLLLCVCVFRLRGKEKLVKLEYNEFGSVNRFCCWCCCCCCRHYYYCYCCCHRRRFLLRYVTFRFNTISRDLSHSLLLCYEIFQSNHSNKIQNYDFFLCFFFLQLTEFACF